MASREEDNRSMRSCKSGILEYMILSIKIEPKMVRLESQADL
jgi:hypothetical protein